MTLSDQISNLGSMRLTSSVQKYCNITTVNVNGDPLVEGETCVARHTDGGFSILDRTAAYGLPAEEWYKFFEYNEVSYVEEMTRRGFAVHYWNYMRVNSRKRYAMKPKQPLYKIFQANCPATEEHLLRKLIGCPY